mmetsp:Transcript_45175/g.89054  ORF Transcript_45175/g.89054 Transcript_45175/m.89054 type:complete len:183 (-) Transcript_45175:78-626(-)
MHSHHRIVITEERRTIYSTETERKIYHRIDSEERRMETEEKTAILYFSSFHCSLFYFPLPPNELRKEKTKDGTLRICSSGSRPFMHACMPTRLYSFVRLYIIDKVPPRHCTNFHPIDDEVPFLCVAWWWKCLFGGENVQASLTGSVSAATFPSSSSSSSSPSSWGLFPSADAAAERAPCPRT